VKLKIKAHKLCDEEKNFVYIVLWEKKFRSMGKKKEMPSKVLIIQKMKSIKRLYQNMKSIKSPYHPKKKLLKKFIFEKNIHKFVQRRKSPITM